MEGPFLVFVCMFPNELNEREGTMQRAKSIDSLVRDLNRIYLDISIKKHLRSSLTVIDERAQVLHLNAFVHFFCVAWFIAKASAVYVHSVYNALYIAPLYWVYGSKIITDMHGVVPEELMMEGRSAKAFVYGVVEAIALKYSGLLVMVSENMTKAFISKYRHIEIRGKCLKLPILDYSSYGSPIIESQKPFGGKISVVYAGGIQAWQKIGTMLTIIQKLESFGIYSFSLYVPHSALTFLRTELEVRCMSQVVLASLTHRELLLAYQKAHLGFLLRDDILINRVAMPTKAIEYLEHGIVPIVLTPDIGDLMSYNYRYILVDNMVSGDGVNHDMIRQMRQANYHVAQAIRADAEAARLELVRHLTNRMVNPTE